VLLYFVISRYLSSGSTTTVIVDGVFNVAPDGCVQGRRTVVRRGSRSLGASSPFTLSEPISLLSAASPSNTLTVNASQSLLPML